MNLRGVKHTTARDPRATNRGEGGGSGKRWWGEEGRRESKKGGEGDQERRGTEGTCDLV